MARRFVVIAISLMMLATGCIVTPDKYADAYLEATGVTLTKKEAVHGARAFRRFEKQTCAANVAANLGIPVTDRMQQCPTGYLDLGQGVWGPPIALPIRGCESWGDPNAEPNYTAENAGPSTASGAYQFLDSSWRGYGFSEMFNVGRAMHATPIQQDQAFVIAYERDGTTPWNASKHCWG